VGLKNMQPGRKMQFSDSSKFLTDFGQISGRLLKISILPPNFFKSGASRIEIMHLWRKKMQRIFYPKRN